MAIDKVKKVAIFGLAGEFAKLSHGLLRMSMLHVDKIETVETQDKDSNETLAGIEEQLSRVAAAIEAIKPYAKGGGGFLSAKQQLTEDELLAYDSEANWAVVNELNGLGAKLPILQTRAHQTENALVNLRRFAMLDAKVGDIKTTKHAFMALGTVPETDFLSLGEKAAEIGGLVESVEINKSLRSVFIAVHIDQKDAMETAMREANFVDANLHLEGTVAGEIGKLEAEAKAIADDRTEILHQLSAFAEKDDMLKILYDCCAVKRQRAALTQEAGRTSKAFYLTGWVRDRHAQKLKDQLELLSDSIVIEFIDPQEGETPPTAMRNNMLLSPFEAITEMYSAPSSSEADPTYAMAPFFLCFFGMMVSDAAYGIILTVLSLIILKVAKPKGMSGKIIAVIAMGGIATFIWGIILGSWFGEALLPPLWFNPLEEPILMLLLCLGLGMLHITAGILMKAKALIKERKYIDVVFDCGFILCVLWGAVAAFAGLGFGMTVVLVGVIGIFLTAGRDRKGLHKKLLGGFGSVYGLSGYLSDVLSYSRLFGMGIATGVISMVFNTIARLLMGNIIGIIFGVIVMIIGHTFNIAINTLGAYVHASRLQYIEFYNKFFEGGGRVFVPFAFRTKYIQIIQ